MRTAPSPLPAPSADPASREDSSSEDTTAASPVLRAAGRATLLTIVFVLLSRVLGVIRTIAITHLYGQNEFTDIYIRAFAVPDMLYLMMAGGALSTVFTPVFIEYLQKHNEEEAWTFFGRIVTLVALGITGLILVAELLAAPLSRLVAPNFSPDAVARMVPLTRILLPAQWFFFVGGLFIATLQSRNRWLVPNLAPLVYNIGIIAGAFIGKAVTGGPSGIVGMTWGAVLGAFLGNFLLPLWDLNRSGVRWHLKVDAKHPGVRKFWLLLGPAMLGLGLSQLGFLIAGFFPPEGGKLSALRNGYELTQAPIGIFAQASALVLFPTLARLFAADDRVGMREELDLGLRRILFLTVPSSLLMAVLAEPIIIVLYAGSHFGAAEVADAALALRLYSLGTFAWSAQAVAGRGFFAMQDTRTPFTITKWMILLFTALCFISSVVLKLSFGALAVSMSLVGTINVIWLLAELRHRLPGLNLRGMAAAAGRIFLVAAAASAVAWGIARAFPLTLPDVSPLLALERRLADARQEVREAVSEQGSAEQVALEAEVQAARKALEAEGPALEQRFRREVAPLRLRAGLALVAAGGAGVLIYGVLALLFKIPELRTVRALFRRTPAS